MKIISFLSQKTTSVFKNWSILFRKRNKNFMERISNWENTKQNKKSLPRKCFIPFFYGFIVYQAFSDKFLWFHNKTENANSSFWGILKSNSLKIRQWNQHAEQGRPYRARETLIRNFLVKDQFRLYLFLKTQKYPSTNAEQENHLRCQFTVEILYLNVRLWDFGHNRGSHEKRLWELAGLAFILAKTAFVLVLDVGCFYRS